MVDLREEIRRRAAWFYETQLRGLNYDAFRGVRSDHGGDLLNLISEPRPTFVFPGQFGRLTDLGPVYLDSQQPVWTDREEKQHGAFAGSLLGRMGDWLNAREPRRLVERLKVLREELEASRFGSSTETMPTLGRFGRRRPEDHIAAAISRAELASAKPWLIPELYNFLPPDPADTSGRADIRAWVANLELYVKDFETELSLSVGGIANTEIPFDVAKPSLYRALLAIMLAAAPTRPASDAVKIRLLELKKDKPEDKEAKYHYGASLATNGSPMGPVDAFKLSGRAAYWSRVFTDGSLKECVVLKPNSDMGLCQLVRLAYRYGTLPASLNGGGDVRWRRRLPPDANYRDFMAEREKAIGDDQDLLSRFRKAETKLRIILEESAAHPRAPDPSFSPLAGEILKQGLLSYKFWLDERPRALENERLNKVKGDLDYGKEIDKEMEFWSENHYIMFASSEYLLGQLWQDDLFQPCRLFVDPGDRTGERTGLERRNRGRARVLKWLNNRLMFGWMEFNSSGYYREHLWALLNLVDFALDEEVRVKAEMAVDLMLFDVTRYLHRGTMGAAGGRSQFKSKSHGFDNGLGDVVEIMLGVKGVFSEGGAQIAASFASSTYEVPLVLLEIGLRPPQVPFMDRSRVSITFDEAPKYGIIWSQDSIVKDANLIAYASKRARYSPFLADVNKAIAATHNDYGGVEDDTVFFWGMSAFFNKQVVRNTYKLIHRFGLNKADAFGAPRVLVDLVSFFKAPESSLLGFSIADLPDRVFDAARDEPHDEIDERTADDLSVILEGSTRSRANILTYRSPGSMLSSLQNFRPRQLNFQSNAQQATLNGAVNVFVNAGFGDIDMSELVTFAAGFVVGGAVGILFGPIGALVGSIGGGIGALVAQQNELEDTNPLNDDHEDGPDWWTGNWAMPRILQHGGAVIMLSDFHEIQEFLAETGSHAWFPKSGFDRVVERRTSAYNNADFPLLDIGHIGPKGFWLFGKVVHPVPEGSTAEAEEGYVGVFSNKRPEWLTRTSEPYEHRLEQRIEEDAKDPAKADLWTEMPEFFSDKDWYVNGKNIWIVQVGSRSEFGSFETFMDRVSSARVHIDDVGDLECTYDIPQPDGTAARLRLTDGDEPEFELNGQPLATDLFPRFETPFVRGGLVEWQQRTYCLEWNGHSLLHDFSDMQRPLRSEEPEIQAAQSRVIRALVIHLRTGDEAMEAFMLAKATVDIGCERVGQNQVVAAGPIGEETAHDAEWIYLDKPVLRSPDMTIEIAHPTSGGDPLDLAFLDPAEVLDLNPKALLGPLSLLTEIGSPAWKSSFRLKALMGDHRLRDCNVAFSHLDFEGDRRTSGPRPFSVQLAAWEEWTPVGGALDVISWVLATHPPMNAIWQDYHDLFALDGAGQAWHRRSRCGGTQGFWQALDGAGTAPDWKKAFSWTAVSDSSGQAVLFVVSDMRLIVRVGAGDGDWSLPWVDIRPMTAGVFLPEPVPIGPASTVTAVPATSIFDGTADLYITGADGAVYLRQGWRPGDTGFWRRLDTSDFELASTPRLQVVGRQIVARSRQGGLWVRDSEQNILVDPGWQQIESPGFIVGAFAATGSDTLLRLAVREPSGEVSVGECASGGPTIWRPTASADGWRSTAGTDLVWVEPQADSAWLLAVGADGTIRSLALGREEMWRPAGAGKAPATTPSSHLAAACRTAGQIELFTDTAEHALVWTWWS